MPSDKELAGTGLTRADYEEEGEVWPENWPVVELFCRLGTQWSVGMNGKTGLRYEAVYPLLDRLFAGDWQQTFDDLQVLERAALNAMHDKD